MRAYASILNIYNWCQKKRSNCAYTTLARNYKDYSLMTPGETSGSHSVRDSSSCKRPSCDCNRATSSAPSCQTHRHCRWSKTSTYRCPHSGKLLCQCDEVLLRLHRITLQEWTPRLLPRPPLPRGRSTAQSYPRWRGRQGRDIWCVCFAASRTPLQRAGAFLGGTCATGTIGLWTTEIQQALVAALPHGAVQDHSEDT